MQFAYVMCAKIKLRVPPLRFIILMTASIPQAMQKALPNGKSRSANALIRKIVIEYHLVGHNEVELFLCDLGNIFVIKKEFQACF